MKFLPVAELDLRADLRPAGWSPRQEKFRPAAVRIREVGDGTPPAVSLRGDDGFIVAVRTRGQEERARFGAANAVHARERREGREDAGVFLPVRGDAPDGVVAHRFGNADIEEIRVVAVAVGHHVHRSDFFPRRLVVTPGVEGGETAGHEKSPAALGHPIDDHLHLLGRKISDRYVADDDHVETIQILAPLGKVAGGIRHHFAVGKFDADEVRTIRKSGNRREAFELDLAGRFPGAGHELHVIHRITLRADGALGMRSLHEQHAQLGIRCLDGEVEIVVVQRQLAAGRSEFERVAHRAQSEVKRQRALDRMFLAARRTFRQTDFALRDNGTGLVLQGQRKRFLRRESGGGHGHVNGHARMRTRAARRLDRNNPRIAQRSVRPEDPGGNRHALRTGQGKRGRQRAAIARPAIGDDNDMIGRCRA